MSHSLTRLGSKFRATVLVSLGLLLTLSQVRAELPTSQQLIRQTEEACREYEKQTGDTAGWPLSELAQARAYAEDYAGAIRAARSVPGVWGSATLQICWKIHFELTGTIAELPTGAPGESDLQKIMDEQARVEAAKVLACAGRLADAEKFLPRDNEQDEEKARLSSRRSLTDFYLFLADDQARRGDRSAATTSLRQAWAILERLPERMRSIEWLDTIGNLWLRLGNPDQALAAQEAAVKLARDRSRHQVANTYSARGVSIS